MDFDEIRLSHSSRPEKKVARKKERVISTHDALEKYDSETFGEVSPYENELGRHMLARIQRLLPVTQSFSTEFPIDMETIHERDSLNRTRIVRLQDGTRAVYSRLL